jgi:hypothetical protein
MQTWQIGTDFEIQVRVTNQEESPVANATVIARLYPQGKYLQVEPIGDYTLEFPATNANGDTEAVFAMSEITNLLREDRNYDLAVTSTAPNGVVKTDIFRLPARPSPLQFANEED